MSCCFLAAVMNSVGLAVDIFGVILLFYFGLTPDVSKPAPGTIIRWGGSPVGKDEERRYMRHWCFSYGLRPRRLVNASFGMAFPITSVLIPSQVRHKATNLRGGADLQPCSGSREKGGKYQSA